MSAVYDLFREAMLPLSSSYFTRPHIFQVSKNASGFLFFFCDIRVASWCIEDQSINAGMEADGSRTVLEENSSMVGKYQGLFPPQHGEFAQSKALGVGRLIAPCACAVSAMNPRPRVSNFNLLPEYKNNYRACDIQYYDEMAF